MEPETTEVEDQSQQTSIWPNTMWPEIIAAAEQVGKSAAGLNDLILKYWNPLRIFLLFRFRHFPEIRNRADELLLDFAEEKILAEGWLKKANPEIGRFRNYLKTSLKNYVIKRMTGRMPPESLERLKQEGFDPAEEKKADAAFHLGWAQVVLAETLERVEKACTEPERGQPRRGHIWEIFRERVLDPIYLDRKPTPYKILVEKYELRSPLEGSDMLLSAKRMFKRIYKEVIKEYAGQGGVAESEVRALAEYVETLAKDD